MRVQYCIKMNLVKFGQPVLKRRRIYFRNFVPNISVKSELIIPQPSIPGGAANSVKCWCRTGSWIRRMESMLSEN